MTQYEDADGDTFDYGLAPGESFEPDDLDQIDRSRPHIMTVLGPVEPGALGVTNPRATFITGSDDPAAILREIEEAGYVGINALVNLDPLRSARDAEEARWLAGRCDLHLIVTVGAGPAPGAPADAGAIVREIEGGIGGAGVYPGAIVSPPEPASLRAANEARLATGLPLIVRVEPESRAASLPSAMRAAGIESRRVIVAEGSGSFGDEPSTLLAAGCILLVDAGGGAVAPAVDNDELARLMIADDWLDQLLLGHDPTPATPLSYGQGSRWSWLIEQFPLQLLDRGLTAPQVRALMIDNPNDAFTIYPPEQSGSPEERS